VLLATARELFTDPGYDAVSQEKLVSAAGLTRGALYHHFRDKQDVFRAVTQELESELTEQLEAILGAGPDFLTATIVGLKAFLDAVGRPDVNQILVRDGPRVLGWEEWRAFEQEYSLGMLERHLARAAEEGLTLVAPVPVLARMVLSASIEAGLLIADSADPGRTREECEAALVAMFAATVGA
jgi:AcrR family transcriptional regulator